MHDDLPASIFITSSLQFHLAVMCDVDEAAMRVDAAVMCDVHVAVMCDVDVAAMRCEWMWL